MVSTHDTVIDKPEATDVDGGQLTVIDRPQRTVIDRMVLSGHGRPYTPLVFARRAPDKQTKLLLLSAAFLCFVGILSAVVLGNDTAVGTAGDKSAILVKVAPVQPRVTAEPVHSTGVLAARRELTLAFKMPGLLRTMDVAEGQFVRAGQLLAALDASEVEAQVRQTRESVAKANRDFARVRSLTSQNALPLQVMQDARTQQAVALAALQVAEFNQRYAKIIAPNDGIVVKVMRAANELVPAGAPVIEFAATQAGWVVRTGVADRDVLRLRVGDGARVRLGGYPDQIFSGRVSGIAGKASAATGTFDVEVEIDPGNASFLSGLVAKVDLEPVALTPMVSVPIEALLEGDGRRGFVFVLGPDHVHVTRQPVSIAFIDDPVVVISEGLVSGQLVITDGAAYLKEGAPVRLPQATVAGL